MSCSDPSDCGCRLQTKDATKEGFQQVCMHAACIGTLPARMLLLRVTKRAANGCLGYTRFVELIALMPYRSGIHWETDLVIQH